MSTNISMHYLDNDPSPTVEVVTLDGLKPVVKIGDYPQALDLFLSTPAQARDMAASMVAAARTLDAWADAMDPDPITTAAERLIGIHEQAAS